MINFKKVSTPYSRASKLPATEKSIVFLLMLTGMGILSIPVAAIVAPIFNLGFWFVAGLVVIVLTVGLAIEGIVGLFKKDEIED